MPRKKRQPTPKATLAVELPTPRPPWHGYAAVRIRHPSKRLYYNGDNNGAAQWTLVGYSRWTMAEWMEVFSKQYPDGRNWEFFGEVITIWPKGYEGYSTE